MPTQKKVSGYMYASDGTEWSVETDYRHGKIYLSAPHCETDLTEIKEFGQAIITAVQDMRKDCK